MDEVGGAVLEFNKKCGKAEKAIADFNGRLQKRLWKTRKMLDEKCTKIVPEIASILLNDVEKVASLGRVMADVNEKILTSMENIFKIEYKLTKVFADMCQAARQTKKSTFNCFKYLTVFFKEELFATQKQAIFELIAEIDETARPWKNRTDAMELLLEEMANCRFKDDDDFFAKVKKFQTIIGLFRGYKPIPIIKCSRKIISMGGKNEKPKSERKSGGHISENTSTMPHYNPK